MKTDIEIAHEYELKKISDIALDLGIDEKFLESYGFYKAKIDLGILRERVRLFWLHQ